MALAVTSLLTNSSTSNTTAYTTATSATPTAGALVVVFVSSTATAGSTVVPTLTGTNAFNITWTARIDKAFNTLASPANRICCFTGIAASGTAGTITFTYSTGQTSCLWQVQQFTGQDTTTPVPHTYSGGSDTATLTPSYSLSPAPGAANATIAGFMEGGSSSAFTVGTGYTQAGTTINSTLPNANMAVEYDLSAPGTTCDCTWSASGSVGWGGVAIEVAVAATVAPWFPNTSIASHPSLEDEALLGNSTSFFEHIGTSAKVTGRRATNRANNRFTSPGRAALNVTFGAITARGAPRSQVGSQFAAPYTLVDVILGYDPQARDDPEEYERLLFARPRTQTPLDVVVIPPPNPPPVIASNRGDPLEDESLLGTSTSFFVHFREGQKKSNTSRQKTLNNRFTTPGRPAEGLYFGAITARSAPRFQDANQFSQPYLAGLDVIYGYDQHAQDDPEEYERLLYARPRALTPLAAPVAPPPENPPPVIATNAIPAEVLPHPASVLDAGLPFSPDPVPPTVADNAYRIDDEGLYGTSITAGDQGTDTVRPLGRPNPDSSRNNRWIGYKQEASKHFLNAIRARSAPGFLKGGVGAEILEYWPQFVYEAEELPHPPEVIQPPLGVVVTPPDLGYPPVAQGPRSFDDEGTFGTSVAGDTDPFAYGTTGRPSYPRRQGTRNNRWIFQAQSRVRIVLGVLRARLGFKVYDPLQVDGTFASTDTTLYYPPGAPLEVDEPGHPPEVIQPPLTAFAPPPENPPPPFATGARAFDEGPRPTKVVQALQFTPAPVPPALIIGPRGTDEGARPTRVIQAPLGVAPPTGMFTGPISARSTWTILPDGLTLFVTPGRFQDPPDPVGGVNRLAPRFLPFTPAPTPPPFTGAPRGFDEGSRPETVWDWSIRYTPAPVPPPFATGRRGFDEGARPQRLFQAPPFVPPAALIRPEVDQMGGGPDVDQLVSVGDSRPSSSTGDADALGVTGETDSTGRGTEYG